MGKNKFIKFYPLKRAKGRWGEYWKDGYYKVRCHCGCGQGIKIYSPTKTGGIFDDDVEIGEVLINIKDMKKMLKRIRG